MSLRGRLAERKRPSTVYRLRIDDDGVARAELVEAQHGKDAEAVAVALAGLDACYELLPVTALPPVEMESLLAMHPPSDEQRLQHKALFNPNTFVPALLAACIKSDVTEEDWADYTTRGAMTSGEVNSLFNAVWDLNYRTPDLDLPKGSTLTHS